jgi:hypothetical protein
MFSRIFSQYSWRIFYTDPFTSFVQTIKKTKNNDIMKKFRAYCRIGTKNTIVRLILIVCKVIFCNRRLFEVFRGGLDFFDPQ